MEHDLFVIAEAGVNHNGSLDLALELVDAAASAGADAVKFQTFRVESLVTADAPLAGYQKRAPVADSSQFEMLKKLELDGAAHRTIAERCASKGIEFMSTPFDVESVDLLADLGVRRFKIPSGEITNPLLLRAVAKTARPAILSTGMATLGDVEFALDVLASVACGVASGALWTRDGRDWAAKNVTVLHCTTEYPAPPESVNLGAMATIATAFGVSVGYSDHTLGTAVSIAAVALGAVVIEKHFTLDRALPGPDHAASLEVAELPRFIAELRTVREALGDGRKVPQPSEIPNRLVARRSIVARTAISAGDVFDASNLTVKRPGTGVSAARWDEVLGTTATRAYQVDDLIER